jgi:inorganic triphosphatase YgiF
MEIELKFQISASAVPALVTMLKDKGAQLTPLQANYYDSAAHDLFKAGITIRLRKEGKAWVQTLKVGDQAGAVVRQEHNVPVKAVKGSAPALDIERHRQADGWSALERVMHAGHQPTVHPVFSTHVKRMTAKIRTRRGQIEYALDQGELTALPDLTGGRSGAVTLSQPICELEIELVSGSPMAVIEAAMILLKHHALWLDIRSKSARGDALSQGLQIVQARKANEITFTSDISQDALTRIVIEECIQQVLSNASQIASADAYDPEHIHQLRVGLRRLRTALRLFGLADQAVSEAWENHAQALAAAVGHARDLDMIAATILPALQVPHAPRIEVGATYTAQSPTEIMRHKDTQIWFVELVAWQLSRPVLTEHTPCAAILPKIKKWHARCVHGAARFDTFSIEQRHRLRKQMKRLRYGLEFVEPLCKPSTFRAHAKALSKAQEALGDYNDLHTALAYFRLITPQQPEAWFAVGWLSGQIAKYERRCSKVLKKFSQVTFPRLTC